MMRLFFIPALFMGLLFPSHSPAVEFSGNADLGREKAQTCMTCHGPGGVSKYPSIPILAGQQPLYIARQIKSFQNARTGNGGTLAVRKHPTMNNHVTILSRQDIDDIAAFFAAQNCKPVQAGTNAGQPVSTPNVALRCLACHGRFGETGRYSLIPNLYGQNGPYLLNQLNAFYSSSGTSIDKYGKGERHHRIMSRQARLINENDIEALARYFSSVPCE